MFNIKTSDKVPSGYIFCIKEGSWQQPLYPDKETFERGSRLLQTPRESVPGGTGGGRATEPGRQMVVIRLDATKCIFWNFRSPRKTCWFSQRYRLSEVE